MLRGMGGGGKGSLFYLDLLGVKLPLGLAVQALVLDTTGDEAVSGGQGNGLERPLDAVIDLGQQAWAQLHRQWLQLTQ